MVLPAGEVLTFNTLRVTASTQVPALLAKAIIARMQSEAHTVLECYGGAALVVAVQVGMHRLVICIRDRHDSNSIVAKL